METRFLLAVIGCNRACNLTNDTFLHPPCSLSRSTLSEPLFLAREGGRARQIRADGSVENSSTH